MEIVVLPDMSKMMKATRQKGYEAALEGRPRRCPYKNKRGTRNMIVLSRMLGREWFRGYDNFMAACGIPTTRFHKD